MEECDQNKLFVGGVSWETTEDALKEHFSKYGTVAGSVIARDRNTGTPRGFAFVSFTDPSAVGKALEDVSHNILGRTVEVKRAIPRGEQNQQQSRGLSRNSRSNGRSNDQIRTKKIFVGGLSADLTEDEFKSYFEKFGRITDVVVMHDNVTQRPRGFGFITFDSEDAVEGVMQQSFHELSGKLVEVKRAVPKDANNSSCYNYTGRTCGGRGSNFNSYQNGDFTPYRPRYDLFLGYGPLSGYGSLPGYPYGGVYGGGYPFGGYCGIGHGMPPVAPRGLWTGSAMIGVRGSSLPYSSAANVFSAYTNGGVGVTGVAANCYHGIVGTSPYRKSSQPGVGSAQGATDRQSTQIDSGNVDSNSLASGGSYKAAASKQNERVIDGQLRAYSAGNST